jgi:hypothetical protein
MTTSKLVNFRDYLTQAEQHTNALFISNLIAEIEKRPMIQRAAVEQWLKSAFQDDDNKAGTMADNCIHLYNREFHRLVIGCLQD